MSKEAFSRIYQRASERKGGECNLSQLLYKPLNQAELAALPDAKLLAEFTKKVFMSGFVWRVVEQKWPGFEEVFFHFDIDKILMMPEEMLERKAADPKIIRNFNKVKTIPHNALMLKDLQQTQGSAAAWLAEWPENDIVGLWLFLKKQGSRLGGNTGAYALRTLGKDTFILSRDVEGYFRANGLIDGGLMTLKSLKAIQATFNQWQQESGLSLQEMSQVVAYATGDNQVGVEA